MLDPRWNTFLILCETMNYTRAAERLCLTQPAVTHQIQSLESELHLCRIQGMEPLSFGVYSRAEQDEPQLREFLRLLRDDVGG